MRVLTIMVDVSKLEEDEIESLQSAMETETDQYYEATLLNSGVKDITCNHPNVIFGACYTCKEEVGPTS